MEKEYKTENASVSINLLGCTITSWKYLNVEQLFQSKTIKPNKLARGGIPIVFPQFGPGVLPQHGFARLSIWTLVDECINKDLVTLKFRYLQRFKFKKLDANL
jgi:glucose-6-phosphate 1-epimerase